MNNLVSPEEVNGLASTRIEVSRTPIRSIRTTGAVPRRMTSPVLNACEKAATRISPVHVTRANSFGRVESTLRGSTASEMHTVQTASNARIMRPRSLTSVRDTRLPRHHDAACEEITSLLKPYKVHAGRQNGAVYQRFVPPRRQRSLNKR